MTGNIVGEPFDPQVVKEIERRQSSQGAGYNNSLNRSPEVINYLSNRNAWLKLASSVNIDPFEGKDRLIKLGLDENTACDLSGNELAKQSVLFNTLSGVNSPSNPTFRSGISSTNSLWNPNVSYGLGGTEFGISPTPGLIDAQIDCINRGSIREATINLKAYNKFQFELIETLYLRIGFTMLLEWGWDKYLEEDINGNLILKNIGSTLIDNFFFKNESTTHLKVLQKIQTQRRIYNYNYDGFFGKVKNFDWSFNNNGEYDITINLITLGDVIESIQANLPANKSTTPTSPKTSPEETEEYRESLAESLTEQGENIEYTPSDNIILNRNSNIISAYLFNTIESFNFDLGENKDYFSLIDEINTLNEFREFPYTIQSIKGAYNFFISFKEFIRILEGLIPNIYNGRANFKMLLTDLSNDNIITSIPEGMVPLDPRICIFKNPKALKELESLNTEFDFKFPYYLQRIFNFVEEIDGVKYGNLGKLYLNYDFINKSLNSNIKEGKLSLFKFLQSICNGINDSFSNTIQLEPIIKNDNTITILDQNPIPGVENILPKLGSFPTNQTAQLEVYGYNSNNSNSNFVKNLNFKTKITPELSSMVTIGATANGVVVGEDATAFSKWNTGLVDRFNQEVRVSNEVPSLPQTPAYNEKVITYRNFYKSIKDPTIKVKNDDNQLFIFQLQDKISDDLETSLIFPDSQNRYTNYNAFDDEGSGWDSDDIYDRAEAALEAFIAKHFGPSIEAAQSKSPKEVLKQSSGNYLIAVLKSFGGIFDNPKISRFTKSYSKNGQTQTSTKQTGVTILEREAKYYTFDTNLISDLKSSYKIYLNRQSQEKYKNEDSKTKDQPSNQVGFIPLNLSLTLDGISGLLIYNRVEVNQNFLPYNYDASLNFILEKVNHKISGNSWDTEIQTISVPKLLKPDVTFNTGSVNQTNVEVQLNDPRIPILKEKDPAPIINFNRIGSQVYSQSPLAKKLTNKGYKNGNLPQNNPEVLTFIGETKGAVSYYYNKKKKRNEYMLHPIAYQQFLKWKEEMDSKSIPYVVSSAYRNIKHQNQLKGKKGDLVATAGTSAHGFAGALDFSNLYTGTSNLISNLNKRINDPNYQRMAEIGAKYGWYNPWRLSDVGGKIDEAWHFEYWGPVDDITNINVPSIGIKQELRQVLTYEYNYMVQQIKGINQQEEQALKSAKSKIEDIIQDTPSSDLEQLKGRYKDLNVAILRFFFFGAAITDNSSVPPLYDSPNGIDSDWESKIENYAISPKGFEPDL